MTMRGLAWDDNPKQMERLEKELREWRVSLEIVQDQEDFNRRLMSENWDFVVTDLLDDREAVQNIRNAVGIQNATLAAKVVDMVFVFTNHLEIVDLRLIQLPRNVIFKSKDTPPAWLASEIRDMLDERGLYVDRTRAFLIHGHDPATHSASSRCAAYLRSLGLAVVTDASETVGREGIPQDLVEMMRPCGAFVAVCSPDEVREGQTWVPQGSVIFEMGVAAGLANGLERLIILQEWGSTPEEQAILPCNFGEDVTIRFDTNCEEAFPRLEEHLKKLRMLDSTH